MDANSTRQLGPVDRLVRQARLKLAWEEIAGTLGSDGWATEVSSTWGGGGGLGGFRVVGSCCFSGWGVKCVFGVGQALVASYMFASCVRRGVIPTGAPPKTLFPTNQSEGLNWLFESIWLPQLVRAERRG